MSTPSPDSVVPSITHRRRPDAAPDHCLHPDELLRGMASLPKLTAAFKSGDPACLEAIRGRFEELNGAILDSYITPNSDACAVLVQKTSTAGAPGRTNLLVWIDRKDRAIQVSEFADVLWRTLWLARRTEGTDEARMPPQERAVVADMLYTVAVFLLGSLDVVGMTEDAHTQHLEQAAKSADSELDKLEHYIDRAAIRATFRCYLFGLPVGTALLGVPIAALFQLDLPSGVRGLLVLSIVAGGIGAIASVMVRITRGQKLSVDTRQSLKVTFLAGMLRPWVGAVLGVALYVLVVARLVPVSPAGTQPEHFYAGLAFLAGFSERWAQDTIVRSAPISPSPATVRTSTDREGRRTRA
ncbi:MAG TPA: hypothetical protein VGP02_10365 [Mycobacteriales bacterium]|jgi:hypothetical protein|nr:hypothetical protein [Mycobacteriales bacterium]